MENRRFFAFILFAAIFLWLWGSFIVPKFVPPPREVSPVEELLDEPDAEIAVADGAKADAPAVESVIPDHPLEQPTLGSLEPDSGYALEVQLTSKGAAIDSVRLTSPQYRDLEDEKSQATIVGTNATADRTFSMAVQAIDRQLTAVGQTLETANWKLVSADSDDKGSAAVFEYDAPDGTLRVRKSFSLPKVALKGAELAEAWRTNPEFYTVQIAVEVINLSDTPRKVGYEIQGPVGLLLENREHTVKYRDIQLEFLGGIKPATLGPKAVKDLCDALDRELGRPATVREQRQRLRDDLEWTSANRYAGLDVQFFAALIATLDERSEEDQISRRRLDRIYPVLIEGNSKDARLSDISFRMVSNPITLEARGDGDGDSVVHKYALLVCPKHRELLDPAPFTASQVLNYGFFGFVARGMHLLLDTFSGFGFPYFLAIISLTVLVRGCLFPISRKQAISAARMKELQPELTALKAKLGDDKEKLARAQMELWRKHGINPLGGCLPLALQLPIFIGLYTALNSAVDLRLKSFLWIENLAGPDALFRLPFALPYLGQDFSILPLATVALFLIQQKMFMPPAQDEQQELQYKMMNIMTVAMGVMFWHQPAGLCLYFIASSVWSIAERKLLGNVALAPAGPSVVVAPLSDPGDAKASKTVPAASSPAKPAGFFQRLLDAAQDAQRNAEQQREKDDRRNRTNGKKK
jgi:YidC/Oxa1 family membrane protein insertase